MGTLVWQPQADVYTLTVCVKGTFTLVHGRDATLAAEQEPVEGDDRYFSDNPRGSLYCPSDLAPFKPRADVVLVGHAYAPEGQAVDALVAKFTVGDLTKSVGIIGDRVWVDGPDGLEPGPPALFPKMPLRYERAAKAASNPVGFDLAKAPRAGAPALPNLETIDDAVPEGHTVGFGPIPPGWASRKSLLSAAAAAWRLDDEAPVPQGFDFGFYNAAPRDQQVDLLRYSAKIVLTNLHPEHARLETRLPPVRPKVFLLDSSVARATDIALRCDTVWIDTDRGIVSVCWRGLTSVGTRDPADLGKLVVAIETKGTELRYKHIERMLREGSATFASEDYLPSEDRNPLSVRHDSVKPGRSVPPMPTRTPPEPKSPRGSRPAIAMKPRSADDDPRHFIADEDSTTGFTRRPSFSLFSSRDSLSPDSITSGQSLFNQPLDYLPDDKPESSDREPAPRSHAGAPWPVTSEPAPQVYEEKSSDATTQRIRNRPAHLLDNSTSTEVAPLSSKRAAPRAVPSEDEATSTDELKASTAAAPEQAAAPSPELASASDPPGTALDTDAAPLEIEIEDEISVTEDLEEAAAEAALPERP